MKRISFIVLILTALILLFSCEKKEDQVVLGSLYGVVTDKATGAPLKYAGVELKPSSLRTVTGDNGNYEFVKVEQGTYNLYVSKAGYKDSIINDISVKGDGKDKQVDVQLEKLPPALTILDANGTNIDTIDFGDLKNDIIRSFNIFNNNEDVLDWQITWAENWIELNKNKGQLKANGFQTIVIKIDRSKLIAGVNKATLIITSDNGNKELFILATGEAFVETNDATNVSATSAILNGKISRKPPTPILHYGFVYNLTPTPSLDNGAFLAEVESEPAIAPFSYMVTNLETDKNYYYRVYATTSDSIFYGEERSFYTHASLPEVETTKPTAETPTQAIGGGNVISDGGFKVVERGVCWSSINAAPTVEKDAHTSDGDGTGSFISHIEPLQKGTKYYVRAYARNEQGTNYGKTEPLEMPSGEPEIFTTEPTATANTITTGGNITSDGGYTITERGVCYNMTNTEPTINDLFIAQGTGLGQYRVTISGLSINTTYRVRAYAKNNIDTFYGDVFTIKTLDGNPTITTLTTTSYAKSLVAGGNITSDGGFPITERGVCYSTTNIEPTLSDAFIAQGAGTGQYNVTIPGLTEHTTYYVRAYAKNSNGTFFGNVITAQTLYGDVVVLTNDVTNITSNSAVSGVSVADLGGATLQSCGICWGTNYTPTLNNSFVEASTTKGTYTCNITNLTPQTRYYVRAYATTDNGTTYGDTKNFTTLNSMPSITTTQPSASATTILSGGIITSDGGYSITACGVCYSQTNSSPTKTDGFVNANSTSSNTFNVTIQNLTPNTQYYVRAYATNSSNSTAYGSAYAITTQNGNITIITNNNITNITSESATGGYQITETGGANIQSAGICWSTSRYPTINDNTATGGTTLGTYTCNMSGLTAYTTYYVRAYAVSELGTTYGTSYSFKTLAKSDYVDLGLPSGTKWRDHNETGYYTYNQAISYGSKLPTKAQWNELKNLCTWRWTGSGYMVTGLNGNYIILPADGCTINGTIQQYGTSGNYRTSDKIDNDNAWYLYFSSSSISFSGYSSHYGYSVRLIQ